MNYKSFILLFILSILFIGSCSKQSPKQELGQAVIAHYSNSADSLKRKAAMFLLRNIENKFQHTGSNYDTFIQFFEMYGHIRDTFVVQCNAFQGLSYEVTYDVGNISSSYIVENIDKAFSTLEKAKFKDHIDFEIFCEYVLPYRINNEVLENWRDSALVDVPDSIFENDDLEIACEELTKTMVENKKDFLLRFGINALNLPDLPYTKQRELLAGTCDDVAPYSMFLARAAGMPVAQDFTPNYANRSSGHTWCALVLDKDTSLPFNVPNSEVMGEYTLPDFIVSKVYRRTYSDNTESHFFQRGQCEFLPGFMNSTNLIDVTHQYHKTLSIKVPVNNLKNTDTDFVYLCVFDNKNWQVVDWGRISNSVANFQKVPQGVVFLPVIKESSGQESINSPFVIEQDSKIKYIKPDYSKKITVTVKRKYWLSTRINSYMERMIGGRFEASNNPDFEDAIILSEVTENPGGIYNEISVVLNEGFRYYRYFSPKEGYGNIAELEFYQLNGEKPEGKIIGTEGSWENNPNSTREAAFDGNALTFFDSPWPDDSWVGMDFGEPVKIKKIKYLARNDDNNVLIGGDYELFYWDNEWKSHARKTATSDSLTFKNVPAGALYLLHYYGDGVEERIFTYEKGKQVWW